MPDSNLTSPPRATEKVETAARRPSQADGAARSEALWAILTDDQVERDRFCQAWLGLQCGLLPNTSHGLLVFRRGDGTTTVAATWPEKQPPQAELARLADRAFIAKRAVIAWGRRRPSPAQPQSVDLLIAHPFGETDQPAGAVAVALTVPGGIDSADPDAIARRLRWGTGWVESLQWRQRGDAMSGTLGRAAVGLDLLAVVSEHRRLKRAAMAAVNELATRLRCDRVSLGLVRRGGVELKAMSHAASFQNRSQLVDAIESAMEECLFQAAPVAFPPIADTERRISVAHRDLAAASGARSVVASVVLPGPGGRPIGAITLERQGEEAFEPETLKLAETVASLVGPIIHLQNETNGWVGGRIVEYLKEAVQALLGKQRPSLKLAAIAVAAAALFLVFATGEYRVTARSVLEGEVQRAAVAPFDGYINTAPVRPGDQVHAGDLLASLDDKDLVLERARSRAEREKLADKYRDALAKHDRPAMIMTSAQLQQADSQLALADYKLARARVVAPIDGIIVAGDLSQMLGSPIEKGKVLYELAPLADYRLVVQVDERDMRYVEVGQSGALALAGMPMSRVPFVVTRITPISTTEDGRNYFRVEGRLTEKVDLRLRPGMEGVAKIDAGSHSLVWIWTHSVIEWLRLTAWKWLP